MTTNTPTGARLEVGTSRKRIEDPRLLRGEGQYVDDLQLDNVAEVAFVRSAYAHARITRIDVDAARQAEGVLAVWTGQDTLGLPRIPSRARNLEHRHLSPLPPMAWPEVTLAGYPIAAVVATDRRLARDAVDLIEVEYEPPAHGCRCRGGARLECAESLRGVRLQSRLHHEPRPR